LPCRLCVPGFFVLGPVRGAAPVADTLMERCSLGHRRSRAASERHRGADAGEFAQGMVNVPLTPRALQTRMASNNNHMRLQARCPG
jgi:hypothetical protein